MSLKDIVDNTRTDKNRGYVGMYGHSYLELYETLLNSKKETAKNVLEIGIDKGGSIKLWHDYFQNSNIYGLDITHNDDVVKEFKENNRVFLYTNKNAYDEEFFIDNFLSKNIKFDVLLDDGPHTLESMKIFVKMYSQLLKDDGILMIEDLQKVEWLEELKNCTPDELKQYIEFYDLRHLRGRWDDIVFVINKSK
jgi:hypothetical protein